MILLKNYQEHFKNQKKWALCNFYEIANVGSISKHYKYSKNVANRKIIFLKLKFLFYFLCIITVIETMVKVSSVIMLQADFQLIKNVNPFFIWSLFHVNLPLFFPKIQTMNWKKVFRKLHIWITTFLWSKGKNMSHFNVSWTQQFSVYLLFS